MEILVFVVLMVATIAFVVYPFFTKVNAIETHPRNIASKPGNLSSEEGIEAQILKMRQNRTGTCPKCSAKNPPDARFCRLCATGLTKGKKND
jgi:ribosomal protein L40E